MMVAGMSLDDYKGSKDATLEWTWAMKASCVAGQMPSDWPELAATLDSARIHFKFAHELDANLPEQPPAIKWPK